jgi:hypothetical protein
VYLYKDRADAEEGKKFGGTGFLVLFPSEMFPDRAFYFYAASNWHVVCRDGFSTIRINTIDGTDIVEFDPAEWHFLPEYDIAVIPMPMNVERHRAAMIPTKAFVIRDFFKINSKASSVQPAALGVGSDVFMIGRFIDHDGGQTNRPAARFGSISVLPAPIIQPNENKTQADSFCIDMHSRTGHSGSPVFVYRTAAAEWMTSEIDPQPGNYFGLLGIHWGQFPEDMEIKDKKQLEGETTSLILDGKYVKGLSGMTCVLPAWIILEVLNMPKLKKLREAHDTGVFAPQFANQGT